MHNESAYDGGSAHCYPEQGMVDRLLHVHIQSQRAFGPWWTLSYNTKVCTVVFLFSMLGNSQSVLKPEAVNVFVPCLGPGASVNL